LIIAFSLLRSISIRYACFSSLLRRLFDLRHIITADYYYFAHAVYYAFIIVADADYLPPRCRAICAIIDNMLVAAMMSIY